METRVKLEVLVLELLGEHSCVTIPDLGAFIYRESPAASNTFTFELRPAIRTIFFNSAIVADDGLMANAIRQSHGVGYSIAQQMVADLVAEIKSELEKNRNLVFGKLGNFFLNGENQMFFFPSPALNLSHTTYGLPIIKLEELEKNKTEETTVSRPAQEVKERVLPVVETAQEYEEAEVVHVEEKEKRNRGWIWKVAASVALLTLAGSGFYFGRKYFQSDQPKQQQAATIDSPAVGEQSVEPATGENTIPSDSIQPDLTQHETEVPAQAQVAESPAPIVEAPKPEATEEVIAQPENTVVDAAPADYMRALQAAKGNYFVIAGKYLDEKLAINECQRWENNGTHAVVFKSDNSSLYRVVLQRFANEEEALNFAASLPKNGMNVSVKQLKNFK